ncbi:MAG: DegT/DnrJ/EryC1/StrS family aminotransferase [Candidatus Omnitrophica bacterium]|nr:DegT/DnrJ/EryC1/StrS family aminotransferase [Candidatus Omnitrophota bacterium]
MKYNTALPYFPREDIRPILRDIGRILSGSGVMTMGENVRLLESGFSRYTKAKYAVATSSCTAGLEAVLESIALKKGDEVIVPVETFIATGSSVIKSGGKLVFCQIDENYLLDFTDLKNRITSRTKAVIIVHFAGLIHPQIFKIRAYLKKQGIHLIEDVAHAPGARVGNIYAGNIGEAGCFSLYSTKIITCGEGGMITTSNPRIFDLISSLRNRGLDCSAKTEIYSNLGTNRRLSEIQAILGVYQLRRLEEFVLYRNRLAGIYRQRLAPLKEKGVIAFQEYPSSIRHAYWRFVIRLKNRTLSREKLRSKLMSFGIKIDWPYQPLLHLQPVFRKLYGIRPGSFKRSEELADSHFCLPMHMGIKEKDALFITDKIIRSVR